ncbi:helix-hairpin-helix domain-containing protein [Streptomyces sp. NPDC001401]|uniref:helix-hairpin-helix domain-containing protein n=1 Tax=Streptomyces sp. NPDC001401 TaxID=3364570 RepID=UPI0036A36E7B
MVAKGTRVKKRSVEFWDVVRYLSQDGRWYFLVTIPFGWLLGAIPVFHAARVLGWRRLRREGAAFAAAGVAGFFAVVFAPVGELRWSVILLGLAVSTGRAARLRDLAYTQRRLGTEEFKHRNKWEQRYNVRKLVALKPQTAHQMHVEQLEPRHNTMTDPPDGGLVDLNKASAELIAHWCDVSLVTANSIVEARKQVGIFASMQEVVTWADLRGFDEVHVREHGLIYPDHPNVEKWRTDWRSRLRRWLRWHLRHHRIG